MKVSELIATLERFKEAGVDLPISVTMALPEHVKGGDIFTDDNLVVVYNKLSETEEEIGIQNFMY